jgi:hypothetical protein
MTRHTPASRALILCGCLAAITILQRTARHQATALGISPLALTAVSTAVAVAMTRPKSA